MTKKAKAIEKEVGSAVTRVESAREAMARAAQARFEISAQSANVVETFKQELMNQIEETDAEEVIEEATTVYCDECGKSRILTIEEAAGADVDATYWTCAKVRLPTTSFRGLHCLCGTHLSGALFCSWQM